MPRLLACFAVLLGFVCSAFSAPRPNARATAVDPARPGQTIPLVLLEVDGPMQLAKLTSSGLGGWVFYEVEVTSARIAEGGASGGA